MKNIKTKVLQIIVTIVCLYAIDITAQSPQMDYFKGTWRNQTGNNVFTVTLWQDGTNSLKGHYKMVTVNSSGQQTAVLYDSNKPIGTSNTNWPFTLSADIDNGNYVIGGLVIDNTITSQRGFLEEMFSMESIALICNTCVKKVSWKVKKQQGVREPSEPDFNIPVNFELTKVE